MNGNRYVFSHPFKKRIKMGNYHGRSEIQIYATVFEAINDLVSRGYTTDFLAESMKTLLPSADIPALSPIDYTIDEIHRFEEYNSNPSDESILYAISSESKNIKGIILNSFGEGFSHRSSKLVSQLCVHKSGINVRRLIPLQSWRSFSIH